MILNSITIVNRSECHTDIPIRITINNDIKDAFLVSDKFVSLSSKISNCNNQHKAIVIDNKYRALMYNTTVTVSTLPFDESKFLDIESILVL